MINHDENKFPSLSFIPDTGFIVLYRIYPVDAHRISGFPPAVHFLLGFLPYNKSCRRKIPRLKEVLMKNRRGYNTNPNLSVLKIILQL